MQRYPNLIYHAARACAVAGYITLYTELSEYTLPAVHVAEDARDVSLVRKLQGSEAI